MILPISLLSIELPENWLILHGCSFPLETLSVGREQQLSSEAGSAEYTGEARQGNLSYVVPER